MKIKKYKQYFWLNVILTNQINIFFELFQVKSYRYIKFIKKSGPLLSLLHYNGCSPSLVVRRWRAVFVRRRFSARNAVRLILLRRRRRDGYSVRHRRWPIGIAAFLQLPADTLKTTDARSCQSRQNKLIFSMVTTEKLFDNSFF